ncbi:MAG: cyclodeaminase/cyclohydrolase family protein [Oscillospiraceae bacterium]|nr:cyclodeaminase/cyclohydrolase family protein [Oscillospiraceae bacterium]
MSFLDMTTNEFIAELASKNSVPGGGGAAAVAGAMGAALAAMVCNLTVGKQKYAHVEEDVQKILSRVDVLKNELLQMADEDAKCFEPLANAYKIPKDDPKRDEIMEQALRTACTAPLKIIHAGEETLELLGELVEKGSVLALSDVGCGASMCRSAVMSAWISVKINTRDMKDREYALKLEDEVDDIIEHSRMVGDKIYDKVLRKL